MTAFWEHYRFYIRKKGLVASAKSVIARWSASTFGRWEILYSIDLVNAAAVGDDTSARFAVFQNRAEIGDELISELRRYKSEHAISHFFNRWFSRGATLWLYVINQNVVAVQWTLPRGFDGFYSVPISPAEIILVAAEVFPPFRGKGHFPRMLSRLFSELRTAGYRRAYLKVAPSNRAAQRGMSKTCAVRVGRVYTWRLAGMWGTIWSDSHD
jgi:GNAT superfamily N-acetyltransferase